MTRRCGADFTRIQTTAPARPHWEAVMDAIIAHALLAQPVRRCICCGAPAGSVLHD